MLYDPICAQLRCPQGLTAYHTWIRAIEAHHNYCAYRGEKCEPLLELDISASFNDAAQNSIQTFFQRNGSCADTENPTGDDTDGQVSPLAVFSGCSDTRILSSREEAAVINTTGWIASVPLAETSPLEASSFLQRLQLRRSNSDGEYEQPADPIFIAGDQGYCI